MTPLPAKSAYGSIVEPNYQSADIFDIGLTTTPSSRPSDLDPLAQQAWDYAQEWLRCRSDEDYFISNYCQIFDTEAQGWIAFSLWPAQSMVLLEIRSALHQWIIILKARQLGLTWLLLCHVLWLMLFHPIARVALFSRRETEAQALLSETKLLGVFAHLPTWMRAHPDVQTRVQNTQVWSLANGSEARAFPTTAGDSYQFNFALADEFDLVENQAQMVTAVRPTVENGGKMVLLSRSDKSRPHTYFKRTFVAAMRAANEWFAIFLPWTSHPQRTQEWYEAKVKDAMANEGSTDSVLEQYPATHTEALQAPSSLRRIPVAWIDQCFEALETIPPEHLPPDCPLPSELEVYRLPALHGDYCIGMDPAEGLPNSNPSSLHVIDERTGEEVAHLSGQYEPTIFATHAHDIAVFYNYANILTERNNHGFGVLAALASDDLDDVTVLNGFDNRPGWPNNPKGKAEMFRQGSDYLRTRGCIIHSETTRTQLTMLTSATPTREGHAPAGQEDDDAISFMLSLLARTQTEEYMPPAAYTPPMSQGIEVDGYRH